LQIFRLRNGRDHWMVRSLAVNGHTPKHAPGVECRCQNHVLERRRIDVVRAAKSRQRAAGLEQLPRAQMYFFIAAPRVGTGGPIARERRRVENDAVETRNDFFMRLGDRLRLEPVKYIRFLGWTFT